MANGIPQLQEGEPILNAQTVSSGASGYDEFAKTLSGLAQKAEKQTISLLEEQSNAQALHVQNSIADISAGAEINMINNPDNAAKIADSYNKAIDDVYSSSFVNKGDRSKLNHIKTSAVNQIDVMAAKVAHKQMLTDTKLMFHKETPKSLLDIGRAYMRGDQKSAQIMQDTLLNTAESAFKIGSISQKEYAKTLGAIEQTIKDANLAMKLANKGDATARDYHKLNNTTYGKINNNPASTPVDEYVNHNSNHFDEESSIQKAYSELNNMGHVKDVSFISKIKSPGKKDYISFYATGSQDAQSMIDAGTDYITMGKELDDLRSKRSTGLSITEEGKFKRLDNHFDRLKNNEFYKLMLQNPRGDEIHQESLRSSNAIENSTSLSDEEKLHGIKENEDWERQQMINLGYALHIDPKYIKPFDGKGMAPFKEGFKQNQNPDIVIKNLLATDQQLHPYIADSLDKNNQSAVIYILSNAGQSITEGMAKDFVYANQDGFDKALISPDKDLQSWKRITNTVAADPQVQDAMKYIQTLNVDKKNGQIFSDGMVEALSNTVVWKAKMSQDHEVGNLPRYISSVTNEIKKSYTIYNDQNSRINNATLKLADSDLKALGIYAKDISYTTAQNEKEHLEFLDFYDRNPLMLINTPNNVFTVINSVTGEVALDKNGKPLFSQPYTESLRNYARSHKTIYDFKRAKRVREFKESHPFGNTYR